MSFARFLNFQGTDYSGVTGFNPNLDLLKDLADSTQSNIDLTDALVDKLPEFAPADSDFVQQYANRLSSSRDAVQQEYINNGVQAGNRALKDLRRNTSKLWQSTGAFGRVQANKQSYDSAKERLLNAKDIEGTYRDARLQALDRDFHTGIKTDTGYLDGQYNTPQEQAITSYFDAPKHSLDFAKNIKADFSDVDSFSEDSNGNIIGINSSGAEVLSSSKIKEATKNYIESNPLFSEYKNTREAIGIDVSGNFEKTLLGISKGLAYSKIDRGFKPTSSSRTSSKSKTVAAKSYVDPTSTIIAGVTGVGVNATKPNSLDMRVLYSEQSKDTGQEIKDATKIDKRRNELIDGVSKEIDIFSSMKTLGFNDEEANELYDLYEATNGNLDENLSSKTNLIGFSEFIRNNNIQLKNGKTAYDTAYDNFANTYVEEELNNEESKAAFYERGVGALSGSEFKSLNNQFNEHLEDSDLSVETYNNLVSRDSEVKELIKDDIRLNYSKVHYKMHTEGVESLTQPELVELAEDLNITVGDNYFTNVSDKKIKVESKIKDVQEKLDKVNNGEEILLPVGRGAPKKLTKGALKSQMTKLQKQLKDFNLEINNSTGVQKLKNSINNKFKDKTLNESKENVYSKFYGQDNYDYDVHSFLGPRHDYNTLQNNTSTLSSLNPVQSIQASYMQDSKVEYKVDGKDTEVTKPGSFSKFDKIIDPDTGKLIPKEELEGFINTPGLTYDINGNWMLSGDILDKDGNSKRVFAYSKVHNEQMRQALGNLNPEQMKSYTATSLDRMRNNGGVFEDYGLVGNQGMKIRFSENKRTGDIEARIQDYSGENLLPTVLKGTTRTELSNKILTTLGSNFNNTSFDSDINWTDMDYYNHKKSSNTNAKFLSKGIVDDQVEVAALHRDFANDFKNQVEPLLPNNYIVTSMVRSHNNNRSIGGSETSGHLFGKGLDIRDNADVRESFSKLLGMSPEAMENKVIDIPGTKFTVLYHNNHFDIKLK